MSKRSLFLTLWCLCVFSARAQTTQNDLVAQTAEASAASGELTEADYWAKVSELPTALNTRAARTKAEDTYPEFANTKPGAVITFGAGDTKTFENVEIIGRSVVVERGAQITFLNVRFKETSASPKKSATVQGLLTAWDEKTKVTLRNCDFEGQNNGKGKYPSLVHGKAQTPPKSPTRPEGLVKGPAAEFDAEGCYTWGYTSDGWKIARGDVRYCVWDLPINVDRDPILWDGGQSGGYAKDEIVLNPAKSLYESKAWVSTVADNTQEPDFAETDAGVVTRGWRYINPHTDYLHWFASTYPKRAFGCLANADDSKPPLKSTPGSGRIGTNNAWRLDNGDETNDERVGAEIIGCLYYRNDLRASRAVQHATYPSASMTQEQKDDFMFKVRHCRTNADARKAIDNRDWIVVENLRTLDGSTELIIEGDAGARTADYFTRNDATTLPFADTEGSSDDLSDPSEDADFDVFVLSEIGQSEIVHARGSKSFFLGKGPIPALKAANITLIEGSPLRNAGQPLRVVRPTPENAATEVNRGVIAAANTFGEMFPGKHLILAPQAVSGTGLSDLVNNNDNQRKWSDATAVRDALADELASRWAGKKVKKVAQWVWWNAVRNTYTQFTEQNCPAITGLNSDGTQYVYNASVAHSLWDLSGDNRDPLFDESWTFVIATPGPEHGRGDGNRKNYGYKTNGDRLNGQEFAFSLERGENKGKTPMIKSVQAFLDLPFMKPIRGKLVTGPMIATFNDFEPKGEGAIHPSQFSRYGQPLMGSHMLVSAVIGAGYGGPARILGHETTADGKKTFVRIGLPNGGKLSTFGKVKDTSGDSRFTNSSARPHLQPDGTGFVVRPKGQSWPDARAVIKNSTSGSDGFAKGDVKIKDDGTGTEETRYGVIEITWATAKSQDDRLSYHPWGGFNGELENEDVARLPNQHFLIEHVEKWDDGTLMGFPGHAVMPQTGQKDDRGEMILKPGEGYIGVTDNGRDVSGGSIAGGGTGGDGSSDSAPKITARSPALESLAYSNANIVVDWDRKIKLADGVIKIRRTDTDEELVRYSPTSDTLQVRLSTNRTRLFVNPSIDLPKGAPIEVLASRSAIVSDDGTRIDEADKLLARFTVHSGGGDNVANARPAGEGTTDIALYPNPTAGTFTLVLPKGEAPVRVSIVDLSGKVVYQAATQGKRRLPITAVLLTGSYLVKVVGSDAWYVERLMVE